MTEAPERIYHWLESQLSVARFYGGLTYQGHHYTIAPTETGCPLVRDDVLKGEAAERKAADKVAQQVMADKQGDLL